MAAVEATDKRSLDGRWTPGTVIQTPTGEHAWVLPYATEHTNQYGCDAVFVQPLHSPERPWQLWSSNDLTEIPADAT